MIEKVYHVTTTENAELCLQEGIRPYARTQCRPKTLQRDEYYDASRPSHITDLGIKRTRSVYAHVGLEHTPKLNGGWLNRHIGNTAIIAINIDPTSVYVADGLLVGGDYTPIEYWHSLMSLQFYLNQLRSSQTNAKQPFYTAPNSTYGRQFIDRPEKWISYIYMWPEVLIPNGVDASKLELVNDI